MPGMEKPYLALKVKHKIQQDKNDTYKRINYLRYSSEVNSIFSNHFDYSN